MNNVKIGDKIEELAQKIQGSAAFLEEFKNDPAHLVKKYFGADLPTEFLQPIINGIRIKLSTSEVWEQIKDVKK